MDSASDHFQLLLVQHGDDQNRMNLNSDWLVHLSNQVEVFLRKKEDLFGQFYDLAAEIEEKEGVEVTDSQREEVEKLREDFSKTARDTWDTVMSQEMTLVTQTEQVID